MRRSLLPAVLSLSVLLSTLVAAQDASYTFTTVDVPDANATTVFGINAAGQTVGYYYDATPGLHAFAQSGGRYTNIDVPGHYITEPYGINNLGDIVGFYGDIMEIDQQVGLLTHGFLRVGDQITTIDVPGTTHPWASTWVFGINDQRQLVGAYTDGPGQHGFVLTEGQFTTIDFPDAIFTQASDINHAGHIVGVHQFGDGRVHSFLFADGQFTTIDVPGSGSTEVWGINDAGVIVGSAMPAGGNMHGFVLINGHLTTIDAPGADITTVYGINNQGQLVGAYQDAMTGRTHGFLATPVPVDKTPPVITVAASPATLSPSNGKRVAVTVSGTITDELGGSGVQAGSAAYMVMDEYGQTQPRGSFTLEADGSYAFTVALEASRRGNDPDGRHYTIAVSARDNARNLGAASSVVTVPHDQGK